MASTKSVNPTPQSANKRTARMVSSFLRCASDYIIHSDERAVNYHALGPLENGCGILVFMTHPAYLLIGNSETGIEQALRAVENILGDAKGADITTLRYGLFSVDDARTLSDIAFRTARTKAGKAIIVSVERLFHEAQNALLKLFEEPPEDTLIILVIPSDGNLLPTLRSRLRELPKESRQIGRA